MADEKPEVIVIDDEDISAVPDLPVPKEGETIDWEAQAKTFQGMATRRGTKLAKLKDAKPAVEEKPAAQAPKTGELDYGQKAFLIAQGIKEPAEIELIQSAMKETGQSLEAVIASKFVQGQLTDMREEATAKAATPKTGDKNDTGSRDKVDYWLKKGGLPPDTPQNRQLRTDIVNARAKAAGSGSMFTDTPVA